MGLWECVMRANDLSSGGSESFLKGMNFELKIKTKSVSEICIKSILVVTRYVQKRLGANEKNCMALWVGVCQNILKGQAQSVTEYECISEIGGKIINV